MNNLPIGRETARAAWLLLPDAAPVPVYVAETRTGYTVGSYAVCNLARSHIVCAGYFTKAMPFEEFLEAVTFAAAEASKLEGDTQRARRRRGLSA